MVCERPFFDALQHKRNENPFECRAHREALALTVSNPNDFCRIQSRSPEPSAQAPFDFLEALGIPRPRRRHRGRGDECEAAYQRAATGQHWRCSRGIRFLIAGMGLFGSLLFRSSFFVRRSPPSLETLGSESKL